MMMRKLFLFAAAAMTAAPLLATPVRADEEVVRFWDPATSSFQEIKRHPMANRNMESPIKKETIDYAGPYDKGTIVGAGSVLNQSTGPNEVWAGIPARCIRKGPPRGSSAYKAPEDQPAEGSSEQAS